MRSIVAYYFAALAAISTHNMTITVKSQCTVEGCETGDSSISIATEIRQMFAEFHERLQAIDRRSQEQDIYIKQVQSAHELLNASHQDSKTQHDTALKRFEAIDRRLSEHDIVIKNETQNLWELAIAVGIDINGWIVLMHRFDGSLDFNRTWIEYRNGFGDIGRGEFWLGNEKIRQLTNRFSYTLRIEVQLRANSAWYYADYSAFSIDSENNKYTLRLSGFSGGNAGDTLTDRTLTSKLFLDGMHFSTWDSDNDRRSERNCASSLGGGWWHNDCDYLYACFTCIDRFYWFSLRHLSSANFGRLRAARMMIRSK